MAKHNFGPRLVNYFEGSYWAYALNFVAIAYGIDLFISGWAYLFINWGKLQFDSVPNFVVSLINLHTGKPVFALSTASGLVGNHVLIIMILGTIAVIMPALRLKKYIAWENVASLRHGYFYAELFTAFALATHELLWYVSYVVTRQPNEIAILSSPMFDYGIAILIITFFCRPIKLGDIQLVEAMTCYYLAWIFYAGFHVTVGFLGQTIWFPNTGVNAIEIGSWLWLLVWVIVLYEKRRYEGWYDHED